MVSLKDIAAACGVSASTVSKALNDLDDISEKRKAMIRQKANEMGYLPNMAARALKTKMTHNIGVLFIDDYHSGLTHPYFAPVLESLKRWKILHMILLLSIRMYADDKCHIWSIVVTVMLTAL